MDALGCLDGQEPHFFTHGIGEGDGRGFLQQLLVAALQGALTLTQMDDGAVVVRYDLHLDVPGTLNVMLEVELGLLQVNYVQDIRQLLGVMCYEHALAAAAGYRLQDDRVAHFFSGFHCHLIVGQGLAALCHRDAGWLHGCPCHVLVPYLADGDSQGAYPGEACLGDHVGKISVFGEKAVARVNGIRACLPSCPQDGLHVQVAFGGIGRADRVGKIS